MPAAPAASRLRLAVLYLLTVVVWGTTWIAIKTAVSSVPPITASGLRFAVAAPLLALIVWRTPGASLRYPPGKARLLALMTLAYFTLPFALMNLGAEAIPSGLAAVLFATVALFILALSVPVLGARVTPRQVGGIAVALAALAALIARQTGLGGDTHPLGVTAFLVAAGLHATVYVLLKRDAGGIGVLTLNTLPMGIAAVLLCGLGALLEHPDPGAITGASLAAVVYLGAFASIAGFLAYSSLLRHLGPVPLSLVFIFFPAVAQLAAIAGGEGAMDGGSLALLGLILAASAGALTGARPRLRPRDGASAPAAA